MFLLCPKGIHVDDIEGTIDIFNFYADAPLTYLVCDKSFEDKPDMIPSEVLAKVVGEQATYIEGLNTRTASPELFEIMNQAIMTLELFEQSDVRPAFEKYDTDGSKGIDYDEFAAMMGALGYELDED